MSGFGESIPGIRHHAITKALDVRINTQGKPF